MRWKGRRLKVRFKYFSVDKIAMVLTIKDISPITGGRINKDGSGFGYQLVFVSGEKITCYDSHPTSENPLRWVSKIRDLVVGDTKQWKTEYHPEVKLFGKEMQLHLGTTYRFEAGSPGSEDIVIEHYSLDPQLNGDMFYELIISMRGVQSTFYNETRELEALFVVPRALSVPKVEPSYEAKKLDLTFKKDDYAVTWPLMPKGDNQAINIIDTILEVADENIRKFLLPFSSQENVRKAAELQLTEVLHV